MKKVFISILSLCALAASAQDEATSEVSSNGGGIMANSNKELSFVTKNGHQVLPQAGDWGIGISANNPLRYVGDIFGSGDDNSIGNNAFGAINGAPGITNGGTTVFGKYFVNSHTAYRGWITTQTNRNSTLADVVDDGDPTNNILLNDKRVTKQRGILVGAGLEKRRGSGRLIGIYGLQAFVGLGQGTVTSYTYANEYSSTNSTPSDAFNDNGQAVGGSAGDQRVLDRGAASQFRLGGQAFLGVEYFFAPKISLGGEFNFGAAYTPAIKSYETVEFFNATSGSSEEFTRNDVGGANLRTGTGLFSGSLNMNFYF